MNVLALTPVRVVEGGAVGKGGAVGGGGSLAERK